MITRIVLFTFAGLFLSLTSRGQAVVPVDRIDENLSGCWKYDGRVYPNDGDRPWPGDAIIYFCDTRQYGYVFGTGYEFHG